MPVYTTENPQANFCPYCMSKVQPGEVCRNCSLKQGSYIPSPHHIPPGTILMDRYLIGRVLGEGGFGITYIGCDLRLESKVAIKEYFPVDQVSRYADSGLGVVTRAGRTQDSYSQGIMRFLKEARSLARMEKQTAVVAAKDFFEANNTAYIVMEYIQGTDLKTLVAQRGGKISAQEFFSMIEPLFAALDAVHQTGLIHRDISPDNIMLEKGKVRLLDFGCARESIKGTETMTVALKQGYAPVEQYQRKGQGPWTDVYALAAVIYFCLTGKVPPASLDRILEDELVPPRQLGADISAEQEAALMKAMSLSGKRRYQSVATFYEELYHPQPIESLLDSGPAPAPDPDPKPIPAPVPVTVSKSSIGEASTVRKLVLGAAGVLALAAIFVAITLSGGKEKGKNDPNSSETAMSVVPPQESQSETGGGTYAVVSDENSLLNALEDDSVSTITIASDTFVTLSEQTAIKLTKPLYIPNGAYFGMPGLLTVESGGYLEVSSGGTLDLELGFLRAMGGGRVDVKSGGTFHAWRVFAENDDEVILEEGAELDIFGEDFLSEEEGTYYVLRPTYPFRNADRVSNWEELKRSVDSGASAIVVSSGNQVSVADWIDISVPLMVEEGAVLETEPGSRVNLIDTIAINFGTITTEEAGEYECLSGFGDFRIYNYGAINGVIRLENDGNGSFLNLGTVNCTTAGVFCKDFINLGNMNCYGGDGSYFDFQGDHTLNYGTWKIETPSDRTGSTAPEFVNYFFLNCGDITVGADAMLVNERNMLNYGGSITVEDSGALNNLGILRSNHPGGRIELAQNNCLQGWGLLEYWEGTLSYDDEVEESGARLLRLSEDANYIKGSDLSEAGRAFVGSEMTYIDGDLNLSGDWTISAPVVVYGKITIDGSLTVDGSNGGFLICDRIDANNLKLTNTGTVLATEGCNVSEEICVESGVSRLYLGQGESRIQGNLFIREHSDLCAVGAVYLKDATIALENNNYLQFSGSTEITDSSVHVAPDSTIWIRFSDFALKNSDLANFGRIDVCANHWKRDITLDSYIYNEGVMNLDSDSNIVVGGGFDNGGVLYTRRAGDGGLILTGRLQNDGTLYINADEGQSLELLSQGGSFSGKNPVNILNKIIVQ